MQMPEINFSELEIREIGLWPLVLRIPVIILVGVLTIAGMYFFMLNDLTQELETQRKLEDDKRTEFKTKYNLAANLDAYRKQMVDIEASYKQVSRELPSASQVPQLIDTISQEAQLNGLIAQSLKPGDEKNLSGFYKQLAINMVLNGSYNGIASFVSDLAKIPRIVTLHDFNLKRADSKTGVKSNRATTSSSNLSSNQALNKGLSQQGASANNNPNNNQPASSEQLVFTVEARTYWLSTEQPEPVAKPGAKPKPGGPTAAPGAAGRATPGAPGSAPTPGAKSGPGMPAKPGAKLQPMPGEPG